MVSIDLPSLDLRGYLSSNFSFLQLGSNKWVLSFIWGIFTKHFHGETTVDYAPRASEIIIIITKCHKKSMPSNAFLVHLPFVSLLSSPWHTHKNSPSSSSFLGVQEERWQDREKGVRLFMTSLVAGATGPCHSLIYVDDLRGNGKCCCTKALGIHSLKPLHLVHCLVVF